MWMWLCASMPCSQIVTLHAWACDCACTCMWLCAPMLCSQLVTKHACALVRNFYAMQSSRDYACLCLWLCKYIPCSQFVNLHAWACEYAHLRWADSLRLCMHVHVIMPIYAMQPVCNYVQELELCNFMPGSHLVTMHACVCVCAHLCHAVSL